MRHQSGVSGASNSYYFLKSRGAAFFVDLVDAQVVDVDFSPLSIAPGFYDSGELVSHERPIS